MIECPNCQHSFEADFGMVSCPECKNMVVVDIDGNIQEQEQQGSSHSDEQTQAGSQVDFQPEEAEQTDESEDTISEVENSSFDYGQQESEVAASNDYEQQASDEPPVYGDVNGASEEVSEEVPATEEDGDYYSDDNEYSEDHVAEEGYENSEGQVHGEVEESYSEGEHQSDELDDEQYGDSNYDTKNEDDDYDSGVESEEEPMVAEEDGDAEYGGDDSWEDSSHSSAYAAEDLSEIADFGNSEISTAKSGNLLYDLRISGIDSAEIRELIRENITDQRLGINTKGLMKHIKDGVLEVKKINAIKASVLINRLKSLPVNLKWRQNAITQVDMGD